MFIAGLDLLGIFNWKDGASIVRADRKQNAPPLDLSHPRYLLHGDVE